MPTLGQLECSIVWRGSDIAIPEYDTHYQDGVVDTFIPIPSNATRFQVRMRSYGTVLWGLAMFVFIDGEYQCNRNSEGEWTNIELRSGHREIDMADGRFFRAPWNFNRVKQLPDGEDISNDIPFDGECVGSIEVVVLRLASQERRVPFGLPPSNPTAQMNRRFLGGFDGAGDHDATSLHRFGLDGNQDREKKRHRFFRKKPKPKHQTSATPGPPVQNYYNFFFSPGGHPASNSMRPYNSITQDCENSQRKRDQPRVSSSSDDDNISDDVSRLSSQLSVNNVETDKQKLESKTQAQGGNGIWSANANQQGSTWGQPAVPLNTQENLGSVWEGVNNQQSMPPKDTSQFFEGPPTTTQGDAGHVWEGNRQSNTGAWSGTAPGSGRNNFSNNENNTQWETENNQGNQGTEWDGRYSQGKPGAEWEGDINQNTPDYSSDQRSSSDTTTKNDENETPTWGQENVNDQAEQASDWNVEGEWPEGGQDNGEASNTNLSHNGEHGKTQHSRKANRAEAQETTSVKDVNKESSPPAKFAHQNGQRPQPYWNAWREAALRGRPAPRAIYDPNIEGKIFSLREDTIRRNNTTHQVTIGKAREAPPYPELQRTPKYLDDPDHPFSVFVFKYRDEEVLSKMLGRDVRETPQQESCRVMGLSKKKMAEYYLRKAGHETPTKSKVPSPSSQAGYVMSGQPPHFTPGEVLGLRRPPSRGDSPWNAHGGFSPPYLHDQKHRHHPNNATSPPAAYTPGYGIPSFPPSNGYRPQQMPPYNEGNFSSASNTTNDNLNIALRNRDVNRQSSRQDAPPTPLSNSPVQANENQNVRPHHPSFWSTPQRVHYEDGQRPGMSGAHPWTYDRFGNETYDPGHPSGRYGR